MNRLLLSISLAAGLLQAADDAPAWVKQEAARTVPSYPAKVSNVVLLHEESVTVDPDVLYVDEGQVLTSAGVAAGIDLCLHLVRLDHGAAHATRIARRMVTAPYRSGGQAQFLERPVPSTGGPSISDVAAWALQNLDQRITVDDLARQAGLAPRTLARHWVAETGTSPLRWLTLQRLLEARRLLESSDLTVDAIARKSGIGSAAHLRELFARETTTTPSAYRAAHQGARH